MVLPPGLLMFGSLLVRKDRICQWTTVVGLLACLVWVLLLYCNVGIVVDSWLMTADRPPTKRGANALSSETVCELFGSSALKIIF